MFNWINGIPEKVIEKLFLDIIKDFTPSDLQWATDNDASLLLLTQENSPKLLRTASAMARGFKGQGHLLNSTNLMSWLQEKRPEIYLAINLNPKKRAWMSKQVEEFQKFFFS